MITIDLALILLSLLAAYALVKLVVGLPKEDMPQEDAFERWANEEEERER